MLEPLHNKNWIGADRRAWRLSLSLLSLVLGFAVAAWFLGSSWTIRIIHDYIPKEITIPAFAIPSDLVEFSIGLPNYAFAEYFALGKVIPPDWIYPLSVIVFLLAISLLAASLSYFTGIWLYGGLAAVSTGVALFGPDSFAPFGITGQWITGLLVLLVVLPVYGISNWLPDWNLARRWWVLIVVYGLQGVLFFINDFSVQATSGILASLWYPLILASLLFIILNATDILQGVLTLLTREENNTQSWLHFTVFSVFYLANYILIYLFNTGQLVLDIFYPNPFLLQFISLVAGFWLLPRKEPLGPNTPGFITGISGLYVGLAVLFLLTSAIGFASANDLIIEVLEDGITLIHFCMGVSFFLYVLINFFDLMGHGLRVHQVIFRPRYMPVSAIPVFGIAGVIIFMFNSGYFPLYQTLAARFVFAGDHARLSGKAVMAEEFYKQALSMESRNQRSNLSLAGLYLETGNLEMARRSAETSLEKNPSPEAVLAMAQVYRQKGQNLEELLCLQKGVKNFPQDGRLLNNIGVAFSNTIYPDSARHYFSLASQSPNASLEGKVNLGFHYLSQGKEKDGLPSKDPGSGADGDWAGLNNDIVFANLAGEKASGISDAVRFFKDIPEEMQAFVLYHALVNKAISQDTVGMASLVALEGDSLRKYYSEAIDMGKGMLYYRTGNVRKGLDDLNRLYEIGTKNKIDLGLLLGQVYFEQGAYLTASGYFRKAAMQGMKNAWYWYAVSCLDAGNQQEAAWAFREALPYLSKSDRIRVTILADGLGSGQFHNAAQRSDPEKSAFIKINWSKIGEQQLKDLIHLTGDKEAQRFLWKYCFDKAYRENRNFRFQDLYRYAVRFHGKDKKWQDQIRQAKPLVLEASSKFEELEKCNKDGFGQFVLGRLAESKKDSVEAIKFFNSTLQEAPLNNRQAIYSVLALEKYGQRDQAYQKSLELSQLDPNNVAYLKLFAGLAIRSGLVEFAFQTLPRIEILTSKAEAEAFRKYLETELKAKNFPLPENIIP